MNEVKIENTHIQGYYTVTMLQTPRNVPPDFNFTLL
jgi:hypothetical protein